MRHLRPTTHSLTVRRVEQALVLSHSKVHPNHHHRDTVSNHARRLSSYCSLLSPATHIEHTADSSQDQQGATLAAVSNLGHSEAASGAISRTGPRAHRGTRRLVHRTQHVQSPQQGVPHKSCDDDDDDDNDNDNDNDNDDDDNDNDNDHAHDNDNDDNNDNDDGQ